MSAATKYFFSAIFFSLSFFGLATAAEYYGVEWSSKDALEIISKGFTPEDISRSMYKANDSCGKSVKHIEYKKAKICIVYKCGFTERFANIDTNLGTISIDQLSSCRWPN